MTKNANEGAAISAQQAFAKHLAQHAYVTNPFTQQANSGAPVTSVLQPLSLAMPVLCAPTVQNTQNTTNGSNKALSLFSDALNLTHAAGIHMQLPTSGALPAVDMLVLPTSKSSDEPSRDVVKGRTGCARRAVMWLPVPPCACTARSA